MWVYTVPHYFFFFKKFYCFHVNTGFFFRSRKALSTTLFLCGMAQWCKNKYSIELLPFGWESIIVNHFPLTVFSTKVFLKICTHCWLFPYFCKEMLSDATAVPVALFLLIIIRSLQVNLCSICFVYFLDGRFDSKITTINSIANSEVKMQIYSYFQLI